ncbi:MAG: tetratricopeptide repeat protein [Myxococcota bacterium]
MAEHGTRSKGWAGTAALVLIALLLIPVAWDRWDAHQARQDTRDAVEAHRERAAAAADAGEFEEAFAALEAARDLAPSNPSLQRARMKLRVRTAAERPRTLDRDDAPLRYALEVTGDEGPQAQVAAGQLALRDGRLEEARAHFEAALEVDESYAPAHLALGTVARRAGRPVEARGSFERAVDLVPDDVRALNNLGVVYLELDRTEEAVDAFEQAIDVRDNAASRLNLANALLGADRVPEAVAHLRRAAELEPGSAEIWRRLGSALRAGGELPAAAEALRRALELDRTPATAYTLALVEQARGRYGRTADLLRQVLEAEPRHADAAYDLGATLKAMGETEGAVRALERYLRITAGDEDEAERRAEVRTALGRDTPPSPDAAAERAGEAAPEP